jgi:hypothetical protein
LKKKKRKSEEGSWAKREDDMGWAKRKGRNGEIGRGFGVVLRLELLFFKTTQQQTKPMQKHACIKHLVNSKFKSCLI